MKFINKAKTLKQIKIIGGNVPKLKIYKSGDFFKRPQEIIKDIKKNFKNKIAIRSCYKDEDKSWKSNAGKYLSFININCKNEEELKIKIKKVILSYKKNINSSEFFIQEMVKNIKVSGVILTRNLNNYAPCININYYIGNDSSIVTSGKHGSKNIIYIENSAYKIKKFSKLINVINNIKKLNKIKNIDLDIEFAIDKKKKIYILQVRKLVVPKNFINYPFDQKKLFFKLEKKIKKQQKKHHDLIGGTTYFGVMPDWNPAEIIGIKPRPLALSLYKELITDHIWAQNRSIYGYKNLDQFHLMTTFYGTPYIDIRIDFNSWIPKNLPATLSKKIINKYLNVFKNKKYLHDKVEFEILFTCYSLSTEKKIDERLNQLINSKEKKILLDNLKKINLTAIHKIDQDHLLMKELIKKQNLIKKSSHYYLDKIYFLLEDCKKYGTLPFASLARCAFISTEILNSFVEEKIINNEERLKFLSTIKTISTEMRADLYKNKKSFLKKYGHLRPGTYEITSINYRNNFSNYFNNYHSFKNLQKTDYFEFTQNQKEKIDRFINKTKIYKNFDELINFIIKSIKYREYAKFVFTKSIDLVFENLEKFGSKYNLNKDNLSYIKINKIFDLHSSFSNYESIKNLKKHILENKKEYNNNKLINLPEVITCGKDLFIQNKDQTKINFISNKSITGKIYEIKKLELCSNINGIVCIENADPGYDFLFSKNITGLITKYGGQNSHMAIRCAEINLPALIGVGEKMYDLIIKNKFIKIDCVLRKIDFIN
jgi:hypothetical protein